LSTSKRRREIMFPRGKGGHFSQVERGFSEREGQEEVGEEKKDFLFSKKRKGRMESPVRYRRAQRGLPLKGEKKAASMSPSRNDEESRAPDFGGKGRAKSISSKTRKGEESRHQRGRGTITSTEQKEEGSFSFQEGKEKGRKIPPGTCDRRGLKKKGKNQQQEGVLNLKFERKKKQDLTSSIWEKKGEPCSLLYILRVPGGKPQEMRQQSEAAQGRGGGLIHSTYSIRGKGRLTGIPFPAPFRREYGDPHISTGDKRGE